MFEPIRTNTLTWTYARANKYATRPHRKLNVKIGSRRLSVFFVWSILIRVFAPSLKMKCDCKSFCNSMVAQGPTRDVGNQAGSFCGTEICSPFNEMRFNLPRAIVDREYGDICRISQLGHCTRGLPVSLTSVCK